MAARKREFEPVRHWFIGQQLPPEPRIPMIDGAYRIAGKRWFAVYTNPKCEAKVVEAINGNADKGIVGIEGFAAYVPKEREWRRQSKRQKHQQQAKKEIERPLLVRYVFVELPVLTRVFGSHKIEEIPFGRIRLVDGVREIVGASQCPTPIPRTLVDNLREREAAGAFDKTVKKGRIIAPKWLEKDMLVLVKKGSFADHKGIVEEILPREQVRVGLLVFGRSTPVTLEIDSVRPI